MTLKTLGLLLVLAITSIIVIFGQKERIVLNPLKMFDEDESASDIDLRKEPPIKVALLVEPTPFGYVSGYQNRFKELLHFLHRAGDEVQILTPDNAPNPLRSFLGFPITVVRGFELPQYKTVTLSLDFELHTRRILRDFKPDVIHVASPGTLVVPAIFWSWIYNIPLVMSYHTNLPMYARVYVKIPFIYQLSNLVLRITHAFADLTLCTSSQLKADMESVGIERIDIWQKGINTEVEINPHQKKNSALLL